MEEKCLLCRALINDNFVNHDLKKKEYKIKMFLFRIDELDVIENPSHTKLVFNVENELKHYRSTGIVPNSITDYFIFPSSIIQYSNPLMYFELKDYNNMETEIWRSEEFSINDLAIVDDSDINYNARSDTFGGTSKESLFYIQTIRRERYGINYLKKTCENNVSANFDNVASKSIKKKCKIVNMIRKTKELHSFLKTNRGNLLEIFKINSLFRDDHDKHTRSLENTCFDVNVDSILDNNQSDFLASNTNSENPVNQFNSGFELTCNEHKVNKVQINAHIGKIKENHMVIEKMINDAKTDIRNNRISINKLTKIINKYRNHMIFNLSSRIYPISLSNNSYLNNLFNIRGVVLPITNVIQNYNNNEDKDISTSLGYVMHYILIISKIMDIPLSYHINYRGSFSAINGTPLYIYPNVSNIQIKRSLLYLKSIIYHQLLNYFNINHRAIRKLLSTNNILLWLLTIKEMILNEYYN
ncbi:hypothetical protein FG386_001937 [Cryptosporidium ryanae]|uniref:uncharacterized protein n=1 Tax=Cryptosporidium ryanae TaxID=515981 RepID=UPI003519EBBC|nr:hypothetical protein FG386_001937 [Cryptosporidium ryanae]